MNDLESRFHAAMVDIYVVAKRDVGYNATRYLQMLNEQGGLATARYLINAGQVSDGFTALWERGRLDLTVEHLVLQPEWRALFTDDELFTAEDRMRSYRA